MSRAIDGSGSVMCRNINYICNKYNIDKYIHNTSQLNSICELTEPSSRGSGHFSCIATVYLIIQMTIITSKK